jgi:hypothetical protein
MALITDPDNLSQGASTAVSDMAGGAPTGQTVAFTSAGSNFPSLTAGMYFEIRDHSVSQYNGLWQESGGSPTSAAVTADKVDGITLPAGATSAEAVTWLGDSGALANEKSVHFDVYGSKLWLIDQGNLSVDGVTGQAVYSFTKEEWKADNFLNPFDFPWTPIGDESFELINDWTTQNAATQKRIRSAGWSEIRSSDGEITKQFAGVITLGTFEDAGADLAYYQLGTDQTDTSAAIDFTFAGPVNEAILTYELKTGPFPTVTQGFDITTNNTIDRNDGGSFVTDGYRVGGGLTYVNSENVANNGLGTQTITSVTASQIVVAGTPFTNLTDDNTAEIAVDNREAIKLFLRVRDADPNGKTYDSADLSAIGFANVENQAYRFPLANATDLKIAETDANIAVNTPYTEIRARYLDAAYNRDIDLVGTPRNFGIVLDVGTYSESNGVSAVSTLFTSANLSLGAGEALSDYTGGTLIIHEGADKGTHTISGTPVNNAGTLEITLTVALTAIASNLSFTMQRATPVTASAEQIYEKVQYLLRQASDIDSTDSVVTGETADELLRFVGDTLEAGTLSPVNPNGGGNGVVIEGFDANDTNRLIFRDNSGTNRTYPFVAAGNINWNANLENDADGFYWMYFEYTERFTNTGFGLSSPSADTATLDSSTTDLVAELASGDYIFLSGFTNSDLDGLYVLTGAPAGTGPWTAAVRRVDSSTLAAEAAGASVSLDKNPANSPDAIQVNDNGGSPIQGSTFGSGFSDPFTFDYDNNVQGGRTAGTNAAVLVKAIGFATGQYVETTATITQSTGIAITLVSALERNYDNP